MSESHREDILENLTGDEQEMVRDPDMQREIQRSMNRLKIQPKDQSV